jgi:transcriptional regulator with XRE-family HTH domain
VLPQSHNGRTIRLPAQLDSAGDHIRRKRLSLKRRQRNVAEKIGVDKCSIVNWEANASKPDIEFMPAIIRFLGYNPLPAAKGWGERLVRQRMTLGLTQREAARRIGV